jgi:hypothetical protein
MQVAITESMRMRKIYILILLYPEATMFAEIIFFINVRSNMAALWKFKTGMAAVAQWQMVLASATTSGVRAAND